MKIKVLLTGNQLKEIVDKIAPTLQTEVSIEIDLGLGEGVDVADEGKKRESKPKAVKEVEKWPEPNGSDAAQNLLKCMATARDDGEFKPSDISKLSYQRVLRLARSDYQKQRHGLFICRPDTAMHRRVEEVERALKTSFVQYDKPTDEFIALFKEALPKKYDKNKMAREIHAMKTLMKPSKVIPKKDAEFKSLDLPYILYTHGVYTLIDLKTLERDELREDPILRRMHDLAWAKN